jgi:transposase
MNVTRIGLDIAKQVFQVHGVDEHDKVVLRKTLKRAQVLRDCRKTLFPKLLQ